MGFTCKSDGDPDMILERSPRRALGENGVRYRVAACRQRLRNSRTTHRAINQSQMDHDPREPGLPRSEYFDEAGAFVTPAAATRILLPRQPFERRVTLALIETEEKVGIT